MRYEYLALIGAVGLAYLLFEKVQSIAKSLKNIEACTAHLSMQLGVVNERLHDLTVSLDDCKWNVEKIKDATDGLQSPVMFDDLPPR